MTIAATVTTVQLGDIVALPQMRGPAERYKKIAELAQTIGANGLQNPLTVWTPSREQYKIYCRIVRRLFGDAKSEVPSWYDGIVVLVAGHRRRAAICRLLEEDPSTCMTRFPNSEIPVVLYGKGLGAVGALCNQLTENISQSPIPPAQTAKAVKGLWVVLHTNGDGDTGRCMTQRAFAGQLGMSQRRVSEALRFCELPQEAQVAVSNGIVTWGCAMELSRLQRKLKADLKKPKSKVHSLDIDQKIILFLAAATALRTKDKLREVIDKFLEDVIGGQGTLFDEFALTVELVVRHLLERSSADTIRQLTLILMRINAALNNHWVELQQNPGSTAEAERLRSLIAELDRQLVAFLSCEPHPPRA